MSSDLIQPLRSHWLQHINYRSQTFSNSDYSKNGIGQCPGDNKWEDPGKKIHKSEVKAGAADLSDVLDRN